MKSQLISFLTLIFVLTICSSCKKQNSLCVKTIDANPQEVLVTVDKLILAKQLLASINITNPNIQVHRMVTSSYGSYHVHCHQYVNGINLYLSDVAFHFTSKDEFDYMSGTLINQLNLDDNFQMSEKELKKIFKSTVNDDKFAKERLNAFSKNCLTVEPIYYDLNAMKGENSLDIVKAWKVGPKKNSSIKMIIQDSNAEVISFHNGVIF
ncbi:hypothetical protein CW751_08365 [Brumimicrobium salinarum]|uniref:Uncharacterized protein n=1 Tax=Brumimicrobium salinarum TaxID=2058658 RepID=A0A2I0R2J1_9FLAO|nr:hypothetical protein [Brumimicrobium salinarum]PKR80775.1 hypothetical protein CW751_08365 [Brumimicrobium salinarum]